MDWQSSETYILLNPRLTEVEKKHFFNLQKSAPSMEGIVWLATSGSTTSHTTGQKLVALSKESILIAARASNEHLQVTKKDRWLQVLPEFHIGGLSIKARAFLSESEVISHLDQKWSPLDFVNLLSENQITLASLVPTQVYDLVSVNLKPPSILRAVLVGGGALSSDIYFKARELGWPLLPTFGMTECCSQVATAELNSLRNPKYPLLKKLNHIEISQTQEGFLKIKSRSLLQGFMYSENEKPFWKNPVENNWYITEDLVDISGDYIKPLGRSNDVIKLSGELVNLNALREVLSQVLQSLQIDAHDFALMTREDERLGYKIILVHSENQKDLELIQKIKLNFNSQVLPFSRIQEVREVEKIPRSDLGKILYKRILLS